jgi:membrane protein DedA with SNARE-associated domain
MEIVQHWIAEYGYAGIFSLLVLGIVGLPVPDETLLAFAGYMIFQGRLKPVPAFFSALAGSVCGITLSYIIGRLTGYFVIEKYGSKLHIKMERVAVVHDWFRRIGRFTLTFGYFVPGVRHLTAYVAGASELEYPVFALFAYAGAVLWTGSFLSLGYFLGEQWTRLPGAVHRYALVSIGVVAAAAALAYFVRRRRRA